MNLHKLAKITQWSLLLLPSFALAQTPPSPPPAFLRSICDVEKFINAIAFWFLAFLLLVSVVFLLLAAFNYLTAQGSSEKAEKAGEQIKYAVVGIVVGLLAYSVPLVIFSVIESASPNAITASSTGC